MSPPWTPRKKIDQIRLIEANEYNSDIKKEEIERVIKGIRKESTPGQDGVEYAMIKGISYEYIEIIRKIFNIIGKIGICPEDWKEYQVFFIDKQDKESVRPIALLSCFGKLYERVVGERLNFWAEKHKIMDQEQYGFRKGRSCLDNLIRITTSIKTGFEKKQNTMAAFLDVTAAYDNVLYTVLIHKLNELKCPSRITNMINNWIYERKVTFIKENGDSETRMIYIKVYHREPF